jgi:Fe-S cluster assembly protein SufB
MTTAPEQDVRTLLSQEETLSTLGRYEYGWADADVAGASAQRGLSEAVVRDISAKKNEPEWMLQTRLKALRLFERKPMPHWGADLSGIDFDNIKYFVRSTEKQATSWDELPQDIKATYDRLGIPEAEKARLVGGVAAQYESEVVYHKMRDPRRGQQGRRAEHRGVVRWVVHLRAARRARRHPAAGLLPDQHREHGPVRANVDHH